MTCQQCFGTRSYDINVELTNKDFVIAQIEQINQSQIEQISQYKFNYVAVGSLALCDFHATESAGTLRVERNCLNIA